jgi:chromosome segregation protein
MHPVCLYRYQEISPRKCHSWSFAAQGIRLQLKQLRLIGFKTFADKTEINIDDGMTAIVGPNGSGKSNIVDALLWVLGEQNPRLLRGATSQDVIFSGSDRRKPLGMAEVRLTIDNSDQSLPVDFAEVTITRRIYRSGESQYLLNGTPCRLKDIIELFLDTGVGKGAYSFVSQSEIDSVLSARPEDRRELFEEAAGIKKYRVKKRDALRKLENAEGNLTRVRDILGELEAQRGPLEKQAVAARRYLYLRDRLHEIEVGLLVAELQRTDYELYAARSEREQDEAAVLDLDAQAAALEQSSGALLEQLSGAEAELESARTVLQNARTAVERLEGRLTVMAERGANASRNRQQLLQDIAGIEQRMTELTTAIELDREERAEVDRAEAAAREEWSGEKGALSELEAAVREAVRQAEERQTERVRIARERAMRETALRSARERIAESLVRQERLYTEIAQLGQSKAELELRVADQRSIAEASAARKAEHTAEASRAEAAMQQARGEIGTARVELDSARRLMAEQSARLSTLTELQESHEGFYQGVRAVLNAFRRKEISGHYRPVVDLLTVPEPYRVAIEVALGGSLQDIVTRTEAEAKAGIEWLKRNRAGRATFLAIPLLRPGQKADPGGRGRGRPEPDVLNAADLVEADSEFEPVVRLLLGRVLIVPDMDTAINVSRAGGSWSKIVTLDGELLTPGGALTGGSLQGKGAHLIGRKGEMDDLRRGLPQTRAKVDQLTARTEALTTSLAQHEADRAAALREESLASAALAASTAALSSAERDLARAERELAERSAQLKQLTDQAASFAEEAERLSTALESGRIENDETDSAIAALSDETRLLVEKRDACRTRAVSLEVEVGRLREKREGLTRTIAADRATLASLELQLDARVRLRDSSATEGTEAEAEQERLKVQIEEARKFHAKAEQEHARWSEVRTEFAGRNLELQSSLKQLAQRRAQITAGLHDAELRIARLDVQSTQTAERLQEEYGISREEALQRPEDTTIDKNTAIEVGRLRRELRGMGQVNTGAAEEFERLTERYTFLFEQKEDLEKSRQSLLETIAEIDESTRGVFMETFEAVRTEFQRLFGRLFDGGTTKLVLTNPEDLLETGIDVIAQPPGKKPQHLSLLSGGERALTAVALLFAFLSVRPSPFVLLDEVDAPLDGSNVEKFTELVRDFSQRSQFLLITHNPVTMEAAPTWYGVTMREAGISSVLSYRVPQEAEATEHDSTIVIPAE